MTAIPTTYKGIQMRSRLEATWATVMDYYGIEWLYEPEAFKLSDGTLYLPDFYLPKADMIFEVKGLMTDVDMHKIEQWQDDTDRPVAIGYPNGNFAGCDVFMFKYDAKTNTHIDVETWEFDEHPIINKCLNCGGVSFMALGAGIWKCPCCNESDGDHWLEPLNGCCYSPDGNLGIVPNFENFRPHYENHKWRQRA